MRTSLYGSFLFFPLILTAIALAGCGDGDGNSGTGSSNSSGSGGSGGGGAEGCSGKACGAACVGCAAGGACACDSAGTCVETAKAVCSQCPSAEPAEGSACPKTGLVCELEDGPITVCRARTMCSATGWKNLAPGCSATPGLDDMCPASAPTGACDSTKDPGLCVYAADSVCGCPDGQLEWLCVEAPPAPCPSTAPKLGAVCSDEGTKCVYGSCPLGGTGVGRDCFGGVWTEEIVCP